MQFPFIENTEETDVKIDRKTDKTTKDITYYMKLIDNFRFMSTLVANTTWKNYDNCKCVLEYEKVENNLLLYSCIKCEKYYKSKFNGN